MARTLLEIAQERFLVTIDSDSNGGQILASLKENPPLAPTALTGTADVAPLTFAITSSGLSVRAAGADDAFVLSLPAGPVDFRLVPVDATHPTPQVELTMRSFSVPVPVLRAAQVAPDGTFAPAAAGGVRLQFPDLLLVVTATPSASAKLAPSHTAAGDLVVTMSPPTVLLGPGTVVGLTFDQLLLNLNDPAGAVMNVPALKAHVAPPGLQPLAVEGGGQGVRLGLAAGDGLSGTFDLAAGSSAAATAARPRFLHDLGGRLTLDRNRVTSLKLTGNVDLDQEIRARVGPVGDGPASIRYELALTLDDGWRADATLRSAGGTDWLWRSDRGAGSSDAREVLGAFAVFAPILTQTPPVAAAGGYAALGLAGAAATGLAASHAVSTSSLVIHGAELALHDPDGASPEAFLLFDLETELDLTTALLKTDRPVKVRHKAIGLRLDFGPTGASPQLHPVFDPAQGYALDLSDPGLMHVPDPLGDIVQPTGARMARENPASLDVDLALKADLGIVRVDQAGVRLPLDPAGPPVLTALGAHVDVAGAFTGGGYLKLDPDGGFTGRLDLAIAAIGLRASAGLAIRHARDNGPPPQDVEAVLATLDLKLPVPIPLANSGLGLFGFLGLVGVHYARDQQPPKTALDWFVDAGGDVTGGATMRGWTPMAHHWAFGVGAVIGTIEGGFLFHAKGAVVIEAPGPRLLIVMNADILAAPPGIRGQPITGTLLAVIEIGPDSITIGVVVDYSSLKPLLEVRVPAEAYFNLHNGSDWHLDVGALPPKLPISVRFLSSIRADGYLMIHGDEINSPLRYLPGFAVAAGVRAAFTWGPEAIGLYLRISAQADVGISFKPLLVIGKVAIRGELHLFIVSVEASADAELIIFPGAFYVSAEVCGEVDFFFFSVSGCVKLELGSKPGDLPPADPIVRAVSLHSRSPAVLQGTASNRPVDGSLGNAAHRKAATEGWEGDVPVVPIDAIPVLQFEMRPAIDPGCTFLGGKIDPKLPPGSWVRRGERYYRYTLESVELAAARENGAVISPAVGEGDAPSVWWDRHAASAPGDDNDVQLALLNWIPDPTPAAAERTASLDDRLTDRWGDVCVEVAPATPALWDLNRSAAGPSPSGWTLAGTPWPDPDATKRSSQPAAIAHISEPWRTGNTVADSLVDAFPAYVFAVDGHAGRLLVAPRVGMRVQPAVPDDGDFAALFAEAHPAGGNHLGDALRFHTGAVHQVRLLLLVNEQVGIEGRLRLRPLDDAGNPTGPDQEVKPPNAHQVTAASAYPPPFLDPTKPWQPIIAAATGAWMGLTNALDLFTLLVQVNARLPDRTTRVEIGLAADAELRGPSWGVLVFDATTDAEVVRAQFDSEERDRQIAVVNGALGTDQAKRALLRPDATYTLSVGYAVDVAKTDAQGNPDEKKAESFPGLQQQFRFRTGKNPPERLDPWVLTTSPAQAEDYVFFEDSVYVVFSTPATRKLFGAYGRTLSAVVRAASGKHPEAPETWDTLPPLVKTPFESALHSTLVGRKPCIAPQESKAHERLTVELPLDPQAEYLLDVEADPPAGPPDYPFFRRRFSTSRYPTMDAFAADVRAAPIAHRAITDPAPLASLAPAAPGSAVAISDEAFQELLRALRWGDLSRPPQPRRTIVWAKSPARPHFGAVAALLETPEPLWRFRGTPEELPDADGTQRWQLAPKPWLDVADTQAGGPAIAGFVRSTDGGRTLALLNPVLATAGGNVSISLRRFHHPMFEGNTDAPTAPLLQTTLAAAAPWERTP